MESCLLLIVSCTNNNCTETMIRKDLDKHVTTGCQWRLVHCSYCKEPQPKCQGEVIIILSQLCFKPTAPCSQQKPLLSLPDFGILGKTLHELRKIFVEHAQHVAGI